MSAYFTSSLYPMFQANVVSTAVFDWEVMLMTYCYHISFQNTKRSNPIQWPYMTICVNTSNVVFHRRAVYIIHHLKQELWINHESEKKKEQKKERKDENEKMKVQELCKRNWDPAIAVTTLSFTSHVLYPRTSAIISNPAISLMHVSLHCRCILSVSLLIS